MVSALVAEEEFNFGELTQQEIIPSLEGPGVAVRYISMHFTDTDRESA